MCSLQRIPLATRSKHLENGVHCSTIINEFTMRTQRVAGFVLREKWSLFSLSSSLICHLLLAIFFPQKLTLFIK